MSDTIDTRGIDRAELLAALFNAAAPGQNLARLTYEAQPEQMTPDEARELIDSGRTYFDYHRGRVLKCDVTEDDLKPWLYDRDNGEGAAARVIAGLLDAVETRE